MPYNPKDPVNGSKQPNPFFYGDPSQEWQRARKQMEKTYAPPAPPPQRKPSNAIEYNPIYSGSTSTNFGSTPIRTRKQSKPWTTTQWDEGISAILGLAVGGAIMYFGNQQHYSWFLYVPASLLAFVIIFKLLTGPLHFMVVMVRWLLIVAAICLCVYGIFYAWQTVRASG